MKFDIYFAAVGYPISTEYIMTEKHAPKLFSPVHDKKEIAKWTEAKKNGQTRSKIFIDSGAYTAHTKGTEVDVDKYIEYINGMSDYIDLFAQVDKIPGTFGQPRTMEDILNAPKESWENYLYMRTRVKHPDKLLPIFHQDEDFKWLRTMLEWTDENGNHIPYIGISGAKDKPAATRLAWYHKVFEIIEKSSNPNVKTHAFGTQSTKHLDVIPFTSADATSWLKAAAFGGIITDFGTIRISSNVANSDKNHVMHNNFNYDALKSYVADYGFNLDEMIKDDPERDVTSTALRAMFNVAYLCRWAENYEYKGPKTFIKKGLFDID